ncbi:MAG: efflux RND transporter permease subunit [Planctomycetes bacterium]|nr:efflux RND transporter permease subunit [Planctomycetota bacterium]
MLKSIVEISLRFRGAVLALALWVGAYGIYTTLHAKIDVFPDFAPPQIEIQAEAPGFSAEQVERLVTQPLEQTIAGVNGLVDMRSESIQGLSIIILQFDESGDVFRARMLVSELLTEAAGRMPEGVHPPRMAPATSATMDLLKIGLVSDQATPMELREFADYVVRPRMRAVAGVASVNIFGGEVREIQIQIDPDRLITFSLTYEDVIASAKEATGVRGAGFVESGSDRVVIETRGQATIPTEIGAAVIAMRGQTPVRLRDVAKVTFAPVPKFGDALIQGKHGVLMTMLSQYGSNTMDVTRAAEAALAELEPAMKSIGAKLYPRLQRPATFVETAISNLEHSLWIGAALVALVLFVFLSDVRTALISLTAIPLSLLIAMLVLDRFGVTINTMTLGGLAMALGEVVDDAIIDVENIVRRLRENRLLQHTSGAESKTAFRVVLDASLEVRGAVVYATFIVGLVFVPVIFMSGLQGKLFAPLGIAYILATGASLLVALVVTPALSYMWLSHRVHDAREPRVQTILKYGYMHLLRKIAVARKVVAIVVFLICAFAAYRATQLGGEFLPAFREGHFVLHVTEAPGASIGEMSRLGASITKELLTIPEIETASQQIGRAELGEDPWGPNRSEFHIELKPKIVRGEEIVEKEIRAVLAEFPGIRYDVMTFLGDRIGETITGETAPVVLQIFGDDLDLLDQKAREAAASLARVPGAVDVQPANLASVPGVVVELRRDRLQQFGLRPGDVLSTIQTAYQGSNIGELFEGNRVIDVVAVLDPARRRDPETIGSFLLQTPGGASVPLREVADVRSDSGRASVKHDGARRRQLITCNVEGRDLDGFVAEAKSRIAAEVALGNGMYVAFAGAAESNAQARAELLRNTATAALGILILLAIVFRSWQNLALVLLNLPFAMVGGVFAASIGGGSLSMGSLVGFVTLFGISTRNSIMMVSHFEYLVVHEQEPWGLETALRGASERLVPILMTALVTGLGLLPIAWGSGEAGREIEGPMAIVILGGLVTSTTLNLLVLPALCVQFAKFQPREEE